MARSWRYASLVALGVTLATVAGAWAAPAGAVAGPYRIRLLTRPSALVASGRQRLVFQVSPTVPGRRVAIRSVVVRPSMPAMPMGLAPVRARPLGHGRYLAPLVFTMPGLYRLAVSV